MTIKDIDIMDSDKKIPGGKTGQMVSMIYINTRKPYYGGIRSIADDRLLQDAGYALVQLGRVRNISPDANRYIYVWQGGEPDRELVGAVREKISERKRKSRHSREKRRETAEAAAVSVPSSGTATMTDQQLWDVLKNRGYRIDGGHLIKNVTVTLE